MALTSLQNQSIIESASRRFSYTVALGTLRSSAGILSRKVHGSLKVKQSLYFSRSFAHGPKGNSFARVRFGVLFDLRTGDISDLKRP
jgi:hypothetical protein